MTQPFRIGLFAASPEWQAGVEYIYNLVRSIGLLPLEEKKNLSIHLLIRNKEAGEHYRGIFNLLASCIEFDYKETPPSYWIKLKRKLFLSKELKVPVLRLKNKNEPLDFMYPIIYSDLQNKNYSYPWAAWIPDLQHKYYPQFFSSQEIKNRNQKLKQTFSKADTIIVSSQATRDDVKVFYPEQAYKTKVLNFCSILNFPESMNSNDILKKYNLPEKYFIVCNQFWQHKNHHVIFKALEILKSKSLHLPIVCTGGVIDGRNPQYFNKILTLIHQKGLHSHIYFLGSIKREEQVSLIKNSLSIIQPSYFEGWSTVVEDGKSLGKNLILSDIPVHREQAPVGAEYFDPDSSEMLSKIMESRWKSPNTQDSLQSSDIKHKQQFARDFLKIAGYPI